MAAGNQLEKGICALFVIAAVVMQKSWNMVKFDDHMFIINQCPWLIVQAMANNSITSPMRLVRAVIIPAAKDFGFW
jgi:hypothetical protein